MTMLLHCKITKDTAVKLAQEIGATAVNPYKEAFSKDPKVIRWGVTKGIGYTPSVILNKMNSVKNATDKFTSINAFIMNGVRTAPISTTAPCVGRSFKHTQGQNFWLCWEDSQVAGASQEGAEYFIKYIPVKQEYRVHVIDGKVAFVQQKYKNSRVCSAFMGIQGFQNGWHRELISPGAVNTDIKNTAIAAVVALNLDFGGVDILISLEDGLAYVAEVNSGPSLPNPEVRYPYVKFFKKKLGL